MHNHFTAFLYNIDKTLFASLFYIQICILLYACLRLSRFRFKKKLVKVVFDDVEVQST